MPLDYSKISALLPGELFSPALTLAAGEPGLIERLSSKLAYLIHVLGDRTGEYLFFIGATYIGLLLLKKRRWIYAAMSFIAAVLWLTFHLPVTLYLESLGVDSFAETKHFDLDEARFWLQTLGEAIYPNLSIKKLLVYLAFSLASFWLFKWLLSKREFTGRHYSVITLAVSALLIGVAFQHTGAKAVAFYLENAHSSQAIAKNFDNAAPEVSAGRGGADLMVYIGESTTVMNMGLYGYPRQTTPRLSELARQDANVIVFENVFSTHAHTRSSLLEAFSFGRNDSEADIYLPITKRKRVSVVDILNNGSVASTLIGNQGVGGLWDHTSSVIFKNANKIFRQKANSAGTGERPSGKVWDDDFFEEQLNALQGSAGNGRSAVFLHSYAGHGPYHGNIPESFRKPVDAILANLARSQIKEDITQSSDAIEEYDAAVKYVDYSVSKTLHHAKQSSRPVIFVYFSDHGEAVYSGRGHDSARFKHEMVRVPLIIYFNDAARQDNPGLFEKYQRLASQKEISTLAQLPATLVDLLGIKINNPADSALAVTVTPVIGEKTVLAPIMLRETTEGTTFVNLNTFALQPPSSLSYKVLDRTDDDTKTYVAVRAGSTSRQQVCRTYSSSFEEISRSILVAKCPRDLALEKRMP